MHVIALLGSTALWLLYAWLLSAIVASYLSHRKGYGERAGLASGLLLNAVGILVWLAIPPKDDSMWKVVGPFGRPEIRDRSGAGAASGAVARTPGSPRAAHESVSGSTEVVPPSADTSERT